MIFFTIFKMKIYCDLLFEARELIDIKKEKKKHALAKYLHPSIWPYNYLLENRENFNFSEYHQIVEVSHRMISNLSLVTLDMI